MEEFKQNKFFSGNEFMKRFFSSSTIAFLLVSLVSVSHLTADDLKTTEDNDWTRQELDSAFRSEGVSATDVNHDGKIDVIAGDVWYEAPDWKIHEIRKPGKFVAGVGYSDGFCHFVYDINQDGWDDVIYIDEPGQPFYWYENPKNEDRHWKETVIRDNITNETPSSLILPGTGNRN